jgi:hypothetical protein
MLRASFLTGITKLTVRWSMVDGLGREPERAGKDSGRGVLCARCSADALSLAWRADGTVVINRLPICSRSAPGDFRHTRPNVLQFARRLCRPAVIFDAAYRVLSCMGV